MNHTDVPVDLTLRPENSSFWQGCWLRPTGGGAYELVTSPDQATRLFEGNFRAFLASTLMSASHVVKLSGQAPPWAYAQAIALIPPHVPVVCVVEGVDVAIVR